MLGHILSWRLNNSEVDHAEQCKNLAETSHAKQHTSFGQDGEEHLSVGNILCQVVYMRGWALYIASLEK